MRAMERSMLGRLGATALALVVVGLAIGAARAAPLTVIEYYNATLDHYFMSPLQDDIDALDSGRLPGWSRTGYNFVGFGSNGFDFPAGAPVCRYYIPPEHGDSHFFSAFQDECDAVAARIATDPNYSGYVLETPAAFFAALPDPVTGACPAGMLPVYRLWNQRADSNHRYTADAAVRAAMIARGYLPEGAGPLGVAMCTPAQVLGDARVKASGTSPYAPGCDGVAPTGLALTNAEVEPMLAVNPLNPSNVIGTWQQDRWSDGGARGLRTGYSMDGGRTWSLTQVTFSRCAGGSAANGGDYARASDPWVSIGPTGIAYQIAIAFNGGTLTPGSSSAVLVSRSLDGGATWSAPATLISDGSTAFNDKESITADPNDGAFAYAVWDRITPSNRGPTWFSRTTDGGATWEPARAIYDPGSGNQTINNQIVVLPNGTLVLFFTTLTTANHMTTATLHVMRSSDNGASWTGPFFIADSLSIGTQDPDSGIPIRDGGNIGSIAVGANGVLAVTWQDARFSGGIVEGIAFATSHDGGLTWSTPAQVNRVPGVQALLPAVAVRDDGTYGVLYYDMRNDAPASNTLFLDVWLAQSTDGTTWTESHVSGPFDLHAAPLVLEDNTSGYFVGDYQALRTSGTTFLPFFVQTTTDPANRTDVYASIIGTIPPPLAKAAAYVARASAGGPPGEAFGAAIARNIQRLLARRRVGGSESAPRR